MDKILVVDLCNTIYDSNTTLDFFNYVFSNDIYYKNLRKKNKKFSFKVINKISNKLLRYDMSRALITKILKDKTKDEIDMLALDFTDNFLKDKKIEKVHNLIESYKEKGYKVVIISASYDFIVKAVAKRLNIDSYIASEAELFNDKYTGKVKRDILHKKLEIFSDKYSSCNEIIMITDNETDYNFVKSTNKSYIVINNHNKDFWKQRKNEKIIFLED
ncbi:MAG: HAD family hydrolase [Sarcina sp.]